MKRFTNQFIMDTALNIKCNDMDWYRWKEVRHIAFEENKDIYNAILKMCNNTGLHAKPYIREFNRACRKCIRMFNSDKEYERHHEL